MMSTAMASAAGGVGRSNSKFPFTATQWQELEHQALIYKYMAAGIPIPPDLLFTIKRSLDSSLSSKLFPYQPSPLGWNPYQMGGYGKKIDPEPGRCRRTDGKKWRCSKEAYPDSKYCERHMHRGKNRSRKPVENPAVFTTNSPAPSAATTTATSINNHSHNHNNNNNNGASASPTNHSSSNSATLTHQSLLKNHPSSLYSLPSSDSSYTTNNTNNLYSHSSSYSRERYIQGLKEEVGEHSFFADNSSGSSMRGYSASSIDESWPLSSKQTGGGYPNYLQQLQNSNNNSNHHTKQQQQEKQCYVWGRDFNCDLSMKVEDERENSDKTIHHFFDEWPLKTGGNGGGGGGGNGGRDSSWHDSSSTTHLSISIPSSTSHHDFFLSNSRNHHDG